MHQAFADLGPHERHVIDTTDQTVEQTLAIVGRAIAEVTHRPSGA